MCIEGVRGSSRRNHPLCHVQLLNDVIEPVTFACSVGPGGDVRTIHIYIYIYIYIYTRRLRSTVPLVWGEPDDAMSMYHSAEFTPFYCMACYVGVPRFYSTLHKCVES